VSLRARPVRWVFESAILVAIGVGLAVVDVGLAVFVIVMAIAWLSVAGLERAVFALGRGAEGSSDEPLPLHEAGVEREVPAGVVEAEPQAEPEWREGVRVLEAEEPEPEAPAVWEEEPTREPEPLQEAPVEEPSPAEPEPEPEPVPVVVIEEATTVAIIEPEGEPEPVVVVEERTVAIVEPEPEPAPVQLVEVPPLPPEPPPMREAEPVPARSTVVELPTRGPREWNLWDLERRARERAGLDTFRDEEWAALLVYLREYATPDGMLPPEFDDLIRESFGDLLLAGRT
jgi:hypothetical protein